MTTIIFAFISAFVFSLVLTLMARWLGVRFGAVDVPVARKIHTQATPRSGGLAIALSFFLAIILCAVVLKTDISNHLFWNEPRVFAILGGLVIFGIGFFDDFHRLGPRIKFAFQIFAASLAFYGGIRIETFFAGSVGLNFGVFSYFITVFWFLLFINAVNLIDGLDGLAAGVTFFTSIVMVILTLMQANYLAAFEFAALAGALLGFLRYNFNPASVFMGDGGSYFIGYTIAALSIMGSLKSQVGVTLLIPLVALGVPVFDTILSPIRRFIIGQRLFHPDKSHIHHRLLNMGLSKNGVVLIIYGISCVLCVFAIILINLHNDHIGLVFIALGIVVLIIVRKLGYLEYFAVDKLYGWFRDMSDEAGLTIGRRSFLSLQIEVGKAKNLEDLWGNVCRMLDIMHFDRGELHVNDAREQHRAIDASSDSVNGWMHTPIIYGGQERRHNAIIDREGNALWTHKALNGHTTVRVWARGHHRRMEDARDNGMLRIEIPFDARNQAKCWLVLIKNISKEPIQPFTMRRVEYLRRSVDATINKLFSQLSPGLVASPSLPPNSLSTIIKFMKINRNQ
jgi:UDP-GlcNAc:undecaprenyl-phosphate GlcNAc-1-phosphate transferase